VSWRLQKRQEICVSAWSLIVTILASHYCLLLVRDDDDDHHHPHDTNLSNLFSLGVPVAKPRKQSGVQKQLCWVMVFGFFFFFLTFVSLELVELFSSLGVLAKTILLFGCLLLSFSPNNLLCQQ
jgi:hypothetical protein